MKQPFASAAHLRWLIVNCGEKKYFGSGTDVGAIYEMKLAYRTTILETNSMAKTRIAIACQGGGSQTAFTAGALKALCETDIADEIDVVSISGTSGGAVCAALVWYAFAKGERPIWQRLIDFWKDNSAKNWAEQTFNQIIIESLRMVNKGLVPAFQMSPASPWLQTIMQFATLGQRPEFTDGVHEDDGVRG